MNIRTLAILSIAAGFPISSLGCASASNATDSTVSYIRGDQKATLGAPPPQIASATVAAAAELELPVDSQSADGLVGKVLMHTSDGTKVRVDIKGESNDQSEVTVRVGTFGDKALQQRVLDKIKLHLTGEPLKSIVTSPPIITTTPTPTPTPAISPAVTPAPAHVAPVPTPINPLSPTTPPATMSSGS